MLDDIQGNQQIQLIKIYKKTTRKNKIKFMARKRRNLSKFSDVFREEFHFFSRSKFNLLTVAICSMNYNISLICNNFIFIL